MIRLGAVQVSFGRSESDWRQLVIRVQVHSKLKKGLLSSVDVNPASLGNVQATIAAVSAAAGAGAEYLGQQYGDNIDPEHCAKLAREAFAAEARLMAESTQGVGVVVARLMANRAHLPEVYREKAERWNWLQTHSQVFTPGDRTEMGQALALLHAKNL